MLSTNRGQVENNLVSCFCPELLSAILLIYVVKVNLSLPFHSRKTVFLRKTNEPTTKKQLLSLL